VEKVKINSWCPIYDVSGSFLLFNKDSYYSNNVLDPDDVGESKARENAILAASAPILLKSLQNLKYLIMYKTLTEDEIVKLMVYGNLALKDPRKPIRFYQDFSGNFRDMNGSLTNYRNDTIIKREQLEDYVENKIKESKKRKPKK
jgi:hypothetical protein